MSAAARVTKLLAEWGGVEIERVKPEAKMVDDLGMDSLDLIETIMAIEEEFEIIIADEQLEKCKTVADVIALVELETTGGRK